MRLFNDTKLAVQADLADYATSMRETAQRFDPGLKTATEQFLDELSATDTIPAQLVIAGYELCGGTDKTAIMLAARAIHMTHTYVCLFRKNTQAHVAAANGMHAAHILLANLDAPQDLRLKAVSITNRALLLAMHALASENSADDATLDCVATELTLNPVHVGMVLAGADCAATDAITPFVMNAGKALVTADDPMRHAMFATAAQKERQACTHWPPEALDSIAKLIVS